MQARVRLQVGLRIYETPRDEGARYSQKGHSETIGFALRRGRLVDADCRSHTILGTMGGGQKPTPTTEHRCRFVRAFRPRRNRSLSSSHERARTRGAIDIGEYAPRSTGRQSKVGSTRVEDQCFPRSGVACPYWSCVAELLVALTGSQRFGSSRIYLVNHRGRRGNPLRRMCAKG